MSNFYLIWGNLYQIKGDIEDWLNKLNYISVTRPNITFAVSMVSQFLNSSSQERMNVVIQSVKYIKGALGKCIIYEDRGHTQIVGYSKFDRQAQAHPWISDQILDIVYLWRKFDIFEGKETKCFSKIQLEYKAKGLVTCELIWLK